MKFSWLGCAALTFYASTAQAQMCDALINQSITVSTFEEIAAQLPKVAKKGEFETTEQFEARRLAASNNVPTKPFFVGISKGEGLGQLKYDADAGAFGVTAYVFNATYFSSKLSDAYGSPFRGQKSTWNRMVGVGLKSDSKDIGSYEATNGFGAKTLVKKQIVSEYELFEGFRKGSYEDSNFWPSERGSSGQSIVGQIEMSAADAQNAKPHLRTAVKFVSKAPFYVEAVSSGESPTRDMPYDIIYNTVALIGDMQCAVVYDDRTKTVLWAKETY